MKRPPFGLLAEDLLPAADAAQREAPSPGLLPLGPGDWGSCSPQSIALVYLL